MVPVVCTDTLLWTYRCHCVFIVLFCSFGVSPCCRLAPVLDALSRTLLCDRGGVWVLMGAGESLVDVALSVSWACTEQSFCVARAGADTAEERIFCGTSPELLS